MKFSFGKSYKATGGASRRHLLYSNNKKVMDDFYKMGPIVSSPFVANNTVYFGSADGNCYAIELQK